jgi:hypothetical protein
MTIIRTVLLASAALTMQITAAGAAEPTNPVCVPSELTLAYGNGVWTDEIDAGLDLMDLEDLVLAALPADQRDLLAPLLSYNTTNGLPLDLLEANIQSLQQNYSQFWRILSGLVPMPASFRDRLIELAERIDGAQLVGAQDTRQHVENYRRNILQGKKVVLVAHSQGNFFANQSHGLLTADERRSFGIVGVATPANRVASGGPHITYFGDLVILAVRAFNLRAGRFPPLPANTDTPSGTDDLTGHFFQDSYLAPGSAGRSRIASNVVDTFDSLEEPAGEAEDGIITATLTWGAQPDVDLHAFEPDGTHIFYANPRGRTGFLDVDDVTSFGPEHIYVDCERLAAGTYRFGVNYFRGSGPETARVNIQAGLEVRNFTIPLSAAVGSAGDDSPIPVTTVQVTGNAEDGFELRIGGGASPEAQRTVREETARRATALRRMTGLYQK